MIRNAFKLLLIAVFLTGCGYSTRLYNLPPSIKTVYIESFENKTYESRLKNDLRAQLIEVFQNNPNLTVVSDKESADSILKGSIIGYGREALRYTNDETVEEYRLSIAVSFEFDDLKNNKTIVSTPSLVGETIYSTGSTAARSEDAAKAAAVQDLARRVLNEVITVW